MNDVLQDENWLAQERKKIMPRQINLTDQADKAMDFDGVLELTEKYRSEFMERADE